VKVNKPQKVAIGIIGILVICILIFWNIRPIIHLFYVSPPQPPAVKNIRSDNQIQFDITGDNKGNIHLLWASEGETPAYQKSTNQGKTWALPKSFDNIKFIAGSQIFIRSVSNQVILLWSDGMSISRQLSSDNGNSWDNPQKVITIDTKYIIHADNDKQQERQNDNEVIAPGKIIAVLEENAALSVIFETYNETGIYYSKSENYGYDWNRPIKLFPNEVCDDIAPVFTVAVNNSNIHIVYLNSQPVDSSYAGFCYLRSNDLGESWDTRNIYGVPIDNLESEKIVLNLIGLPKLAVNGTNLHLVFVDKGFYYMASHDNGFTWSKPSSIKDGYQAEFSIFSNNSGQIIIPFISYKNNEKDWWGYFPEPLPDLIGIDDAGPEWSNNDLYYVMITDSILVKTKRLTHQLSYVQRVDDNGNHSIKCIQSGKNPMIFWAGKRKVGKNLGDSQYEIFYKTVAE
jgi:hypothetical protein